MKVDMKRRLLLIGFSVMIACSMEAVESKEIRLAVDLNLQQDSSPIGPAKVIGILIIKNLGKETAVVQNPSNGQATAFIVLDSQGNVVKPRGQGKVHPPFSELTLGPN